MGWFRALARRTGGTSRRPFVISDPSIGFLSLQGPTAAPIVEADRATLAPLFKHELVSDHDVPQCDVLFIYCEFDERGNVAGLDMSVGQVVAKARAYVAVVASENPLSAYQSTDIKTPSWAANIAMVLNRNGEAFARFWRRLFEAMFAGQSMLMAWVEIAPQGPGPHHDDLPGEVMSSSAGHIAFG